MSLLLSLLLTGLAAAPPTERLRVVTTLPDLADMVREVGGERVEVSAIARGTENLHAVVARPSHLVAMSRADLFVQVGRSLEVSFVPGLLENARNERIRPGAPGFVSVSDGWESLDVPADLSRKAGDIHPQGNPHLNLDPRAGVHMATRVFEGLVRVDPGSESAYRARFEAYAARLTAALERWQAQAAGWRGKTLVSYHQEFSYLARAWDLEVLGTIESKPGIPATPNHLTELIARMKQRGCKVILTAPWSNNRDLKLVAEKTGAIVVEVPNQCGGSEATASWIGLMDLVHGRMARALATP
jgi:ABC-type Zn uptake system ZnuABC Zn-binding protein ZnuA